MSKSIHSSRREAVLLECAPIAGGLLGVVALVVFMQLPSCGGEACPPGQILLASPLVLALLAAALLFAANGVGWIAAGRPLVGCGMFFVRGYIASGVYAWFLGSGSDVAGRTSIAMFALSMAITAVSVGALAYVTRQRAIVAPQQG